jgi:hypothetical protein
MTDDKATADVADEAIGLFLEYRDRHGKDEELARILAVQEFRDAEHHDPRRRGL